MSREEQRNCERSGAQVLWGTAEGARIVQSGEEIFLVRGDFSVWLNKNNVVIRVEYISCF